MAFTEFKKSAARTRRTEYTRIRSDGRLCLPHSYNEYFASFRFCRFDIDVDNNKIQANFTDTKNKNCYRVCHDRGIIIVALNAVLRLHFRIPEKACVVNILKRGPSSLVFDLPFMEKQSK